MLTAKVWPEGIRHIQLGIGQLPQQKIADPHLFSSADEEIRIGYFNRPQMPGKASLINLVRPQVALLNGLGQGSGGGDNLFTRSIADC